MSNTHQQNNTLVFKKGTCACESVSRTVTGSTINTHKVQRHGKFGGLSNKGQSIKSRFLK